MIRYLRLSLATALATVGLLLANAPVASAFTCSQAFVEAWEHRNFEGDGLLICYPTNVGNFYNLIHHQAGMCSTFNFKLHDDWDDCISSIRFRELTVNTEVCFYADPWYRGAMSRYAINTDKGNGAFFLDDRASSMRWNC